MADSLKDKVTIARHAVAENPGLGSSSDCKESDLSRIKERMDVIASCGMKVGVVDSIVGGVIKLTEIDSPDGQHHFVPTDWVDHVNNHVHLKKNLVETEQCWKADAVACGE